ncbi:hypothetical protein F0231_09505 [Vibrio sp. RE86]|uniref:hypothetical protein n=1 Tax=Vibrio sp. RE86 TaxID=2607605 RepID=UPI0014934325|nr:hypothetical protein [Vibrio sp. RE86]NOH79976.1 hypothetical protein [Vibrio sp. RE86]
MKNRQRFAMILLSLSYAASPSVSAFTVDKMIVIADKKGNGTITLANDEDKHIFISSTVEELSITNGDQIHKKEYTRDNLESWKMSLTHQKLALKPSEEKTIGLRNLCHTTNCNTDKDTMFLVSFYPSRYGETEQVSAVEINYGFAPVFVIPTPLPEYKYQIKNLGDKLRVRNDSNTLLNVHADACSSENKTLCTQKFVVLAGREKTFRLTETMRANELDVAVYSYDRSYFKTQVVQVGNKDE